MNGTLKSYSYSGGKLVSYRLKLAIGLIFMLDALRRLIGGESRPVDLWVIVIELLVLAIILLDSTWDKVHRFREWRKGRAESARLIGLLTTLSTTEAQALRNLALLGRQPGDIAESIQNKLGPPHPFERDFIGWRIRNDFQKVIETWARKSQIN